MSKVVCVMAIDGREAVTEATIQTLRDQSVPVDILLAGSSSADADLAERNHCAHTLSSKSIISDKWQEGIDEARDTEPDAVLILGSDDWIGPRYCELALNRLEERRADMVGVQRWFMLDAKLLTLAHVSFNNRAQRPGPLGAGRLISRRYLDRVNWKYFPEGMKNCDHVIYKRMVNDENASVGQYCSGELDGLLCVKGGWKSMNSFVDVVQSPYILVHHVWSQGEALEFLKHRFAAMVPLAAKISEEKIWTQS